MQLASSIDPQSWRYSQAIVYSNIGSLYNLIQVKRHTSTRCADLQSYSVFVISPLRTSPFWAGDFFVILHNIYVI